MSKILVIDDKEDNLVTISALLSAMIPESEVITAQSGEDGIKAAEQESPDAILLDIRMPGMDGYEACRRLKTAPRTQHIPIILLTAIKTDTCDLVKGLECGADAYLTKPVDEAVLTAQVNTALRIKFAEDRLRKQKDILEDTVKERTAALSRANTRLIKELEEHKKTEAALLQAQKMESVGRLAGGVAHDFNNMLNVILGYADLIKDKLKPGDRFFDEIVEIEKAANRSVDITRQLLAFSRKQVISPKVMSLNFLIENTIKIMGRLVGEDIEISFSPGKGLWQIKADPSQVDQIIMNLAVNARDAMPDGGRITIETANMDIDEAACRGRPGCIPGEYVMLAISDTGCGMDEETLSLAFEPFFTTKEVGKGTGLGLSTVYGIIKQNNGFIYIDSAPGEGTTVKMYLPRCTEDIKISEPVKKAALPAGGTVLIAEDDAMVRNLAKAILEISGYTVIAAETPDEALAICKKDGQKIELLLTDVVMPEMNGRALSEKIRDINPRIKTLFMSGYTANAITHQGVIDHGMNFIQKPFSMDKLIKKVREVMSRS